MDLIKAKLELPLNGGHVFTTVAHEEVVHVHATGHTSGDGVCNAVDLKALTLFDHVLLLSLHLTYYHFVRGSSMVVYGIGRICWTGGLQ